MLISCGDVSFLAFSFSLFFCSLSDYLPPALRLRSSSTRLGSNGAVIVANGRMDGRGLMGWDGWMDGWMERCCGALPPPLGFFFVCCGLGLVEWVMIWDWSGGIWYCC